MRDGDRKIYGYELKNGGFQELISTGCVNCPINGIVVFGPEGSPRAGNHQFGGQLIGHSYIVDSLKHLGKYIDVNRVKQR